MTITTRDSAPRTPRAPRIPPRASRRRAPRALLAVAAVSGVVAADPAVAGASPVLASGLQTPTIAAVAAVTPGAGAETGRRSTTGGPVGSVVFIRDHDVWVARGDGTSARRVTSDGTQRLAYGSPSQADDGTIVAQLGDDIVRMTPEGRVLNRLDPAPLRNSVGHPIDGHPAQVAISPDGARVAYSFTSFECTNGCLERWATGVTRAGSLESADRYGTSFGNTPQWISNTRLLQGGGGGSEVKLQDLGQDERRWFTDLDTGSGDTFDFEDLADPVLSPDQRHLAAVRGSGDDTHIFWYAVSGSPRTDAAPATPARLCKTNPLPGIAEPTFGADGRLGFTYRRELYVTTDPARCDAPIEVVLTDVDQPSFSAWSYRDAPAPVSAPVNTVRPTITGAARPGGRVRARVGTWRSTTPITYAFQWLRDGRAVRGATSSGYRVTGADRGRAIAVVVTARNAGGTSPATSRAVRVTRR
jgi:hypothetical protein